MFYTEQQILKAMEAAERAHPAPSVGCLSREVSRIADIFGAMAYRHVMAIEVNDPGLVQLIDQFLTNFQSTEGPDR
ncbi:hypothetical protein [Paracidovorax wautersii]|uniref:Uncharacterized protein n=1 Tax=Paracidovorax wautersii TaxID=1177982 RepID=A0A1I2HQC2_9BURK|nr:hypothetical protein [Paracidovorax wautersii]SFF31623.1 hypothetical protein SAMN04489711_12712 [Paracidovorax wautersii]